MKKLDTKKYAPIIFIDSGVGGLSTLFSVYSAMPNENYVYFADQINAPYGNKTKKELKKIIIQNIKNLISVWHPKAIVLACNTATATTIMLLRKMFPQLLIIGTEPAIKPAIQSGAEKVLVLGTYCTIQNSSLVNLFKHNSNKVKFSPMPKLATVIENNYDNLDFIKNYLNNELAKYKGKFDAVVLGCTHYVLIKQMLEDVLKVKSFNGNLGVSNRLKQCLNVLNCENEIGGNIVYISNIKDNNVKLQQIFKTLKGDGNLCVE